MLQDDKDYQVKMRDITPLIGTLLTIIRKLLGSVTVDEGIICLWDFIFLSHAAAHTYITYDSMDHFHWLQQGAYLQLNFVSEQAVNNSLRSMTIHESILFFVF